MKYFAQLDKITNVVTNTIVLDDKDAFATSIFD